MKRRKNMKKRYLLLASLLIAPALASCGKDEVAKGGEFIENNDDLITPNLPKEEDFKPSEVNPILAPEKIGTLDLKKYDIIDSYRSYGIYVCKNEAGNVGFYNAIRNEFIIKCAYNGNFFNNEDYQIIDGDGMCLIAIDFEGDLMIYDNLGNIVFERANYTKDDNLANPDIKTTYRNKKLYFEFSIGREDEENDLKRTTTLFGYDSEGKLEVLRALPDIIEEDLPLEDDNEKPGFAIGDLFDEANKIDLSEYGFENKYLQITETGYVTYYNNGVKEASYYVDQDVNGIIINTSFITQKTIELAEDATEYDLLLNGVKYSLDTKRIDIFTGKTEDIIFNYVINDGISFKNSQGVYTYALANVQKINEYKALESPKDLVMDANLNFLKDYTAQELGSFIKFGSNYYNKRTGILLNSSGEIITHLSALDNIEFLFNKNLIKASYDGKYGLLNENGEVVEEFKYDEITIDDNRGLYYLRDGHNYHIRGNAKIDLNNFKGVSSYGMLKVIYNKDKLVVYNDDKVIDELNLSNIAGISNGGEVVALNDGTLQTIYVDDDEETVLRYTLSYNNKFTSHLTSNNDEPIDGLDLESAQSLGNEYSYIHRNIYDRYSSHFVKFRINEVARIDYREMSKLNTSYIYYLDDNETDPLLKEKKININNVATLLPGDYYLKLNMGQDSIRAKAPVIVAKSFTGATEEVTYEQLRMFKPEADGFYAINHSADNLSMFIYDEDTKQFVTDNSATIINGSTVYNLNKGETYYFSFTKKMVDPNEDSRDPNADHTLVDVKYKISSITPFKAIEFKSEKELNVTGNQLRCFTPTESDEYIVETTNSYFNIAYYDSNLEEYVNLNYNSFNGKNYYYLEANTRYFFLYEDLGEKKFSISKPKNVSIKLIKEESINDDTLFSYKPTETNLYELTDSNSVKAYVFNKKANEMELISPIVFNNIKYYLLDSNNTYFLYYDSSFSYKIKLPTIKAEILKSDLAAVEGDKIMLYKPEATAFYMLKTTASEKTYYRYDEEKKELVELPSLTLTDGRVVYSLSSNEMYFFMYKNHSNTYDIKLPEDTQIKRLPETSEMINGKALEFRSFIPKKNGMYSTTAYAKLNIYTYNSELNGFFNLNPEGLNRFYANKDQLYLFEYSIDMIEPFEISNAVCESIEFADAATSYSEETFIYTPAKDGIYNINTDGNIMEAFYYDERLNSYVDITSKSYGDYKKAYTLKKDVSYFFKIVEKSYGNNFNATISKRLELKNNYTVDNTSGYNHYIVNKGEGYTEYTATKGSSTLYINALNDCKLEYGYRLSTYYSGERLDIYLNGKELVSTSYDTNGIVRKSVDIKKGDRIEVNYYRDYNYSYGYAELSLYTEEAILVEASN